MTLTPGVLARRGDPPEESVRVAGEPGREEERVRRPGVRAAGTEDDSPKPVDHEGPVVRSAQLVEEFAGHRVDHIDAAVPEVADQQVTREAPEGGGSDRDSPRRVEPAARGGSPDQVAVRVEDVDESVGRTGDVVMQRCILLGVSHVELTAEVRDAEWRKPALDVGIRE